MPYVARSIRRNARELPLSSMGNPLPYDLLLRIGRIPASSLYKLPPYICINSIGNITLAMHLYKKAYINATSRLNIILPGKAYLRLLR